MTNKLYVRSWHVVAVVAVTLLVFVAVTGSTAADAAPVEAAQAQDAGAKVYSDYCAVCHQPTGEGNEELYPPLGGSEWVEGDKGRLIRIVLQGMVGPVSVAGTEYNGAMPPWGAALQDAQIAAVSTYIRSSWGNDAPAVTAAEVAAVRSATSSRTTPWTARELMLLTVAEK